MNQAEQYNYQQSKYDQAKAFLDRNEAANKTSANIIDSVQNQAPSTIIQHGLGYLRMAPAAFEKIGSKIPYLAAPFIASDYVQGINNAEQMFNTPEASTLQRIGSGASNVLSGATFGVVPQQTAVNAIIGLGNIVSNQNILKYLK
jgi:hypothetical protein